MYNEECDFVFQLWNSILASFKPEEWKEANRDIAISLLKCHFRLHEKVFDLSLTKRYCTLIQLIARLRKASHSLTMSDFIAMCDLSLSEIFLRLCPNIPYNTDLILHD